MAVLIVDDDAAIRSVLVDLLEDEGYPVVSAANGHEALAYLQHNTLRPCVILLDLMMPVMDGWQFRAAQQADTALATIPVVVLSASENLRQVAQTLAATAYLAKPIDLAALTHTVNQLCH
jgi:CheY-like chemotaxis protein